MSSKVGAGTRQVEAVIGNAIRSHPSVCSGHTRLGPTDAHALEGQYTKEEVVALVRVATERGAILGWCDGRGTEELRVECSLCRGTSCHPECGWNRRPFFCGIRRKKKEECSSWFSLLKPVIMGIHTRSGLLSRLHSKWVPLTGS